MFGFLKRKKAARQAAKAAEVEAAQVAEVDPNSPWVTTSDSLTG